MTKRIAPPISYARGFAAASLSAALVLTGMPAVAIAEETIGEPSVVQADVQPEENSQAQVQPVDKSYSVNSELEEPLPSINYTSDGRFALRVIANNQNASAEVKGDVKATKTDAVWATAKSGHSATLTIDGEIEGSKKGLWVLTGTNDESTIDITVGNPNDLNSGSGDIKSTGTDDNACEGIHYQLNGGNGKVNILATGTVSGGTAGVNVGGENLTLTVWKVEAGTDGQQFIASDSVSPAALEAFKQTVNYIIKVAEGSGAKLSGDSALIKLSNATKNDDYKDFYTIAQKDGPLQFTIENIPAGYRVKKVYGYYPSGSASITAESEDVTIDAATLTCGEDGMYRLDVATGGGINLFVELEPIPEPEPEPEKKEETKPEETKSEEQAASKVALPETGKKPALPATSDPTSIAQVAALAASGVASLAGGAASRTRRKNYVGKHFRK